MSIARELNTSFQFGEIYYRLRPLFRRHLNSFSVGIVLILISTGIEIFIPWLIGKTVDVVVGPHASKKTLIQLSAIYFFLIFARFFLDAAKSFLVEKTGQAFSHDLREKVFSAITQFPVSYFDKNPVGRSVTRVVNDVKTLGMLFTADLSLLFLDVLLIGGSLLTMFLLDWKLSALILLSFPLLFFIVRFLGRRLTDRYREVRMKLSAINAFLGENISAIATIQRLGAETQRMQKFSSIVDAHHHSQMESIRTYALIGPLTNIINGLVMASLLAVGGYWVMEGRITLGILVAFIGYIRNLFFPIGDLVDKYNLYLSAKVSAERIVSILNETDEFESQTPLITSMSLNQPEIEFRNVSFTYPTRTTPALTGVSFKIQAGKSTAIIGATGSGKSSLVRLLLRFYEPNSGAILFDRVPIHQIDKRTLRKQIGLVHQELYLVNGTLRENLTLSSLNTSDEFLIDCCKRAQLWEMISYRGGLEMWLNEGGTNLSLGERQLLSFARILAFNPPVLILDEATSSLDPILERKLMVAVEETLQGRTSLVIAHRLSTLRKCHSFLKMEKGRNVDEPGLAKLCHMRTEKEEFFL